jgi:hypothetical protein
MFQALVIREKICHAVVGPERIYSCERIQDHKITKSQLSEAGPSPLEQRPDIDVSFIVCVDGKVL